MGSVESHIFPWLAMALCIGLVHVESTASGSKDAM